MKRNNRIKPGRGFTLVEVLIVLLIILMLTSITVPVVVGAMEGRKLREGARMLDVFLNGAKNRAMQTGRSVGVVFETQLVSPLLAGGVAGGPNGYGTGDAGYVTTLGYADVPPSYTGDYAASVAFIGGWQLNLPPTSLVLPPPPVVVPEAGSSHGLISFMGTAPIPQPFGTPPIPPAADTGWTGLVRPGDLIRFAGHSELYRLYAGEPWYDVNGNGAFDSGTDLYTDSNGNGQYDGNLGYTNSDGYFSVPPSVAGTWPSNLPVFPSTVPIQASIWCFTYADPGRALSTMWPTWAPGWQPVGGAYVQQIVSPSAVGYEILRSPIPMASGKLTLPDGVCVDMGGSLGSFTYPVANSIPHPICLPGSGYDFPYQEPGSVSVAYTGFRPNWQIDPNFTAVNAAYGADPLPYSRNVIVTFNPTGTVDLVYSWDDPAFTPTVGWRGQYPIGPIYLQVGRTELVGGDPELLGPLLNGAAPSRPVFNFQDPNNLIVSVNPQSGLVATQPNAAVPFGDLTYYGWTAGQQPTLGVLQSYLSQQLYQSRQLARAMASMGGR